MLRILITNDDGYNAPGILHLAKALEKDYEVIVVAPYEEKSASSHSISMRDPLFYGEADLKDLKSKVFWVKGTPADCVKLAFEKILNHKIDYVVSGINKGYNIGTDILYSGTVSAAIEGSIYGIPSIAVSTDSKAGEEAYKIAAHYVREILSKAIQYQLEKHVVLNVNVPLNPTEGIKVCRIGERRYTNVYTEKITSEGEQSFILAGNIIDEQTEGTDTYAIQNGYVTVTPLHYDLTNFQILKMVNNWFE